MEFNYNKFSFTVTGSHLKFAAAKSSIAILCEPCNHHCSTKKCVFFQILKLAVCLQSVNNFKFKWSMA